MVRGRRLGLLRLRLLRRLLRVVLLVQLWVRLIHLEIFLASLGKALDCAGLGLGFGLGAGEEGGGVVVGGSSEPRFGEWHY